MAIAFKLYTHAIIAMKEKRATAKASLLPQAS